ncbi:cytochrome b/b6 domain-containing protein [Alkalimonas collagenimarina]|uniref:Cytochrome b/b6 domain-containing protein n=1 Tax=Alkalimonas collagenimarina TaxID=400390 RepID=A0ABT9GUX6_9GAMM|nr:cytochrome b/b6 domain-containing protein [Alkalimonas collagenimarina]MDP4534856.1 cytochrome b/b6 domain-containing protein [Alkalimonas collagenimarina]
MTTLKKVWDPAVRFFHWSQLLLLIGLWYTGSEGLMDWHQLLAYTLASVLVARLLWGFYGSRSARFSEFAASPKRAWHYFRQPTPVMGHNPASSYMIFALLLLVSLQLISGLMTTDHIFTDGPLVRYVPSDVVSLATRWHKLGIDLIIIASLVHIAAAIWHSWRHHNVIMGMLHGKLSEVESSTVKPLKSSWSYFVLVGVFMLFFYWWQGADLIRMLSY